MTETEFAARLMTCPECNASSFHIYSDGDITCRGCGRVYARHVPELAAVPARPLIGLTRGESPNPLMRHEEDWYFTFGIGHPLTGRYVRFRGTVEGAREQMTAIFGLNWSRQYSQHEALPIIENRDLRELVLSPAQPGAQEPRPEAQAPA